MKRDCLAFVKKCNKCQHNVNLHKAPLEQLHLISLPWPFYMWGVDILGPFPLAVGQVKFLLVDVDYFTKWIKVKAITTISAERANSQAKSANKVILKGLRRRLEEAKGRWVEELSQVLWSYHTTPHSTTQETPFWLMFRTDAMVSIEIREPSPRAIFF
ncbi:hypothetical protein CR513_54197, partial [Mucuna pruriens]